MPYKDDQHPAGAILIVCIEAFECVRLSIHIQHREVCDLLELFFGWRIVVDFDVAFEVVRSLVDFAVRRRRTIRHAVPENVSTKRKEGDRKYK